MATIGGIPYFQTNPFFPASWVISGSAEWSHDLRTSSSVSGSHAHKKPWCFRGSDLGTKSYGSYGSICTPMECENMWNTCEKKDAFSKTSPSDISEGRKRPQKVWSIAAVNAEVQKIPSRSLPWDDLPEECPTVFLLSLSGTWSSSGCFGNDDDDVDDDGVVVVDDDDDGDGCCFLRGQGGIYLSLCFLLHYFDQFWLFSRPERTFFDIWSFLSLAVLGLDECRPWLIELGGNHL